VLEHLAEVELGEAAVLQRILHVERQLDPGMVGVRARRRR
jgi:hypothetical protein